MKIMTGIFVYNFVFFKDKKYVFNYPLGTNILNIFDDIYILFSTQVNQNIEWAEIKELYG